MITATLRDLQWRARRFVIAGLGASVVFALTLVLSGLHASFSQEAGRVVSSFGADTWVVQKGVEGVFTAVSVVPGPLADAVAHEPGVRRADQVVVLHGSARAHITMDIAIVGYREGAMGTPRLRSGRLPRRGDEIVVDAAMKAKLGEPVVISGHTFTVVGLTRGLTVLAGQPLVFVRLADAQALLLAHQPIVSAVLTKGVPTRVPIGLEARSAEQTRTDLLRPIAGAITSIRVTLMLLWAVAAMVIGSVVYLSALERRRDFAVYKATGWSTRSLATGLALQAGLLAVAAALLGLVLAQAMLPFFPLNFGVPTSARVLLPIVGLGVGLLASTAGLRKAVGVEPALAFGGP